MAANRQDADTGRADRIDTSVQEEIMARIRGSKFGIRLYIAYLQRYTDTTRLLENSELVDEAANILLEQPDGEQQKQCLLGMYHNIYELFYLTTRALKIYPNQKVFDETQIQEFFDNVQRKFEEKGGQIQIRTDIGLRTEIITTLVQKLLHPPVTAKSKSQNAEQR